jgi:hypothetical protein
MSMPVEAMPELYKDGIPVIATMIDKEWSSTDIKKQIEFSIAFQAYIRYKYADVMLETRNKKS